MSNQGIWSFLSNEMHYRISKIETVHKFSNINMVAAHLQATDIFCVPWSWTYSCMLQFSLFFKVNK